MKKINTKSTCAFSLSDSIVINRSNLFFFFWSRQIKPYKIHTLLEGYYN